MIDSLISTFCIKRKDLTDEEFSKITEYFKSDENCEGWEFSLLDTNDNNPMVSASSSDDIGLFYLFLVGNKLDKKIEIIRG